MPKRWLCVVPDDPDYVTNLSSRGRFEAALADVLAGGGSSLVAIDVVGLKESNEARGFVAGDAVLRAAADRLRTAASTAAGVFRVGGDEMVAVFTGADAAPRAEAAVRNLRETGPFPRLRVGMTSLHPDDTRESLLDRLYATLRRS